jgi:tetratricopeptide (TPR) repeat protein
MDNKNTACRRRSCYQRILPGIILLLGFLPALLLSQSLSPQMQEIKKLFASGNYSLVLEKSLSILNTREDSISPMEGAFLYYHVGMAYYKNKNAEMAADYLKQIEVKYPASDYVKRALLELAEIFKDDYFLKESYLEKLYSKFPKTPEAVEAGITLVKDYVRLKNFKKALPVLETIVNLWKRGEEKPELYMLLAVAYAGINDYIEAIDNLRIAEKLAPELIQSNPLYLHEAGKISYNRTNFNKAVNYLQPLFNMYPGYKDLPDAAITLAQALERDKKSLLAAVFLVKAAQKRPAKKQLYSIYLHLGRILNTLNDRDRGKIRQNYPLLSNPEKLLNIVKNNSMNFEERKTAAILLSEAYKKNNNMVKSIDNFYKFLGTHRDPLVEKIFKENLDTYLYDLEKNNNHEELFQAWIKLKDKKSYLSPENLLRFGKIFYRLKLYANAEEIYRHLLKYRMFSKHWTTSYKQLIRICAQQQRHKEVLENLKKLEPTQEPEFSEFNYYKLMALENLDQKEEYENMLDSEELTFEQITNMFQFRLVEEKIKLRESEKDYDAAITLCRKIEDFSKAPEKDRVNVLLKLADLFFKKSEPYESLSYYLAALESKTNSKAEKEWIYFRVTTIHRDTGNKQEEERWHKSLKELNPDSFWLRQLDKKKN